MAKKDKYNIKKTLREFVKSRDLDEMKNEQQQEKKSSPKEKDIIDKNTFFVTRNDSLRDSDIRTEINKILEKYGTEQVYLGITGNPYGRMTGNYQIDESKESFENKEDYDIEPHNKPHLDNDYGMMYVLFETDFLKDIIYLEKHFITEFKDRLRNKVPGGGGKKSGPPYHLYAVIRNEALKNVNNTSLK